MDAKRSVKRDTDVDESDLVRGRTDESRGDDGQRVARRRNEAAPDVEPDADDVIDSFEKRNSDGAAMATGI